MKYNVIWNGLDRGHEGYWKPVVWYKTLKIIGELGEPNYKDFKSPLYIRLQSEIPQIEWFSKEENGDLRSSFRDAREPWQSTNVLEFNNDTVKCTALGKQINQQAATYSDALIAAFKKYREEEDYPFVIIASAFSELSNGECLAVEQIANSIMPNYRPGKDRLTDALASVPENNTTTQIRRIRNMLQLMMYAGVLINIDSKYFVSDNKKLFDIIDQGNSKYMKIKELGNIHHQLITYGAPGTGKSDDIKKETANETVFRTTFHPDSDYASFVGAYRPIMKTDGVAFTEVSRKETGSGQFSLVEKHDQRVGIAYKFVEQVFTKAYIKAWEYQKIAKEGETPKRVYLVIEEINRGNCAQVFGDLFQLLDRNQKGFSEYAIQPDSDFGQYIAESLSKIDGTLNETRKKAINAHFPEVEDGMDMVDEVLAGRLMLFPDNLFIRATMNTSDQSLFPMDSAFKRRWDWKYVAIKDHPEKNWVIEIDNETHYRWWDFLEKINKEIQDATSSEDKQLGYFFVRAKNDITINLNMFVNKVVFYLWNSVFKDCYTDCEFMKQDSNNYFTFTGFFDKDGKPDAKQAKAFLGKFKGLKSLEEKKAEEEKKVEESIASSGENNDTGNPASAEENA